MTRGLAIAILALGLAATTALASGTYDPGASDTEIKLGNTFPYSGPSRRHPAPARDGWRFHMINERGGVNGRKIDFISLDDGYIPPKTVELTRRLVEQDQVLAMFGSEGTPTQVAVQPYLNSQEDAAALRLHRLEQPHRSEEIPVDGGAWGRATGFEGIVWAKYILAEPAQRQDRHLLSGRRFRQRPYGAVPRHLGRQGEDDGGGQRRAMPSTDPTVTSQIISLRGAGADTFVLFAQSRAGGAGGLGRARPGWPRRADLRALCRERAERSGRRRRREAQGRDLDRQREGCDRSRLGRRSGASRTISPSSRNTRPTSDQESDAASPAAYRRGAGDGRGAEAVRRHLDPRQYDEGRDAHEGLDLPAVPAGHELNTSPDNYFPMHMTQMKRYDGTRWVMIGKVISE